MISNKKTMTESFVVAAILLVCTFIVYVRPQWISTLRHYTDEERRNIEMKRVRRTAGGGLAVLALLIGPGSWLLARGGVPETTIAVVRMVVLFAGVIAIAARVEMFNHNK